MAITDGERTASGARRARGADLARVERLAILLDARYRIPGSRIRFGLDSVLGLIPGIGDTLALAPSAWMVWKAWEHGLGGSRIARMSLNCGIDYVVGAIPLLGDLFDVAFKANLRNAAILREGLAPRTAPPEPFDTVARRAAGRKE